MREHWHGQRLEIFRNTEAATIEERHGLSGAIEHLRSARGNPESQLFVLASAGNNFESVIHQRVVDFDLSDDLLHLKNVRSGQHGLEILQLRCTSLGAKNVTLRISIRISHIKAHQKTIELRFG